MADLVDLYRKMAAGGDQFRGLSILQHERTIAKLVQRHGAASLLDYGCGAGDAYRKPHYVNRRWGLKRRDVKLYDPAFPTHDSIPDGFKADGVLCSDVLEHVEDGQPLNDIIATLFLHAEKFVWASVCCRSSKKTFPGTDINLHCTVRPFTWWKNLFVVAALEHPGIVWHLTETP